MERTTLPCYWYKDTNGREYFVYYAYNGDVHLLSLRDWGNVPVARFRIRLPLVYPTVALCQV